MSEVKRENFRMYGWKRRATARVGGACKTIAIQTPEIKPRENQKQKKSRRDQYIHNTENSKDETYHIPEPEPSFHFALGVLHPRKRLLTNLQRHHLCLSHPFRIRIPDPLSIINMRQRIQIHFRQYPKSSIHLTLEWQ